MTETSPPTNEAEPLCPVRADIVYRRWRRGYVFATTVVALGLASVLVFAGYSGEIAVLFLRGLMELVTTMAVLYVGAGVIDRSQILTKIGDGFRGRPTFPDDTRSRVVSEVTETRDERRVRSVAVPSPPPPAPTVPEGLSDESGGPSPGVSRNRRRL